jgi:hypothetical protein
MAAILPTGMRAISTEISPETGAGGFILPNDQPSKRGETINVIRYGVPSSTTTQKRPKGRTI